MIWCEEGFTNLRLHKILCSLKELALPVVLTGMTIRRRNGVSKCR
jgi:hypothetical protein